MKNKHFILTLNPEYLDKNTLAGALPISCNSKGSGLINKFNEAPSFINNNIHIDHSSLFHESISALFSLITSPLTSLLTPRPGAIAPTLHLPTLPDLSTPSSSLNSVIHNAISIKLHLNPHLNLIAPLINVHSVGFKFITGLIILTLVALVLAIIFFIFEIIKDLIPKIKSYMFNTRYMTIRG
jgi:hypothetical protein